MEGLEAAPSSRRGDPGAKPLESHPEWNRALCALERGVEAGGGIVVLYGPAGAGKSTALRELARRLPVFFRVVPVAGDALSPGAVGRLVLQVLGAPQAGDPQRVMALHAERLRAQGHSLVLLVDDGEALPDETVRWLARLAQPPETLARVALAAREYAVFLDALKGLGACVDLVRLDPHEPAEPALIEELALEPLARSEIAAPPREPSTAPPYAEPQRDGLLSIEALLGDAEYAFFDPAEPHQRVCGAETGLRSREPPPQAPARETGPAPRAAASPPSPPPSEPAPTAVSMRGAARPPAPAPPVPAVGAGRGRSPSAIRWLVAGLAAAGFLAWLALQAFRGDPAPAVSARATAPPAPEREAHVPVTSPRTTPADRDAGDAGARPPGDARAAGQVPVSELRQVFDRLVEDPAGASDAAARRFLRRHGPDTEGYALLDELDARRARDPEEAVKILTARSRVRAALCAAWADDARAEARERLGCPGSDGAPR